MHANPALRRAALRALGTLRISVLALLLPIGVFAAPLSIDVKCDGMKVGTITVEAMGTGIEADFKSSVGGPPPTLAAAAAKCNEHHFNWFQVVVSDPNPPADAGGNNPVPPYVDPPPGGWNYLWADNLPWYWNESAPADGKNPDGTAYDPGYGLGANTTADTLHFEDYPSGDDLEFRTWLVSLNADGSLHGFHPGFSWEYDHDTQKVVSVGALNNAPARQQYNDIVGRFAQRLPEPSSLWLALTLLPLLRLRHRSAAA